MYKKYPIWKEDGIAKISFGYYETDCDYCGKYFCRKLEDLGEIEEYLKIVCCPHCGGSNPKNKPKKEKPGEAKYKCVGNFSFGFEIEFFVGDPKKDREYISTISGFGNSFKGKWGFDGRSPLIKEFRSDVFYSETVRENLQLGFQELSSTFDIIEKVFGAQKDWKLINWRFVTFGIHLNFGEDFLNNRKSLNDICERNASKNSIRLWKLNEKNRYHYNRTEIRWFGCKKDDLYRINRSMNEIVIYWENLLK